MAEIADVLASYGLRVEPGAPGSLDARVIELVERYDELRTRLERAEGALREAEGRCVVWNVRASLVGPGSIGGYLCALCSARGPLPDVTHTSDCPFAARGAAGEERGMK